jgi:hypothetical protein
MIESCIGESVYFIVIIYCWCSNCWCLGSRAIYVAVLRKAVCYIDLCCLFMYIVCRSWLLTAEPWVHSWVTPCDILGVQNDTGAGFPEFLQFPLANNHSTIDLFLSLTVPLRWGSTFLVFKFGSSTLTWIWFIVCSSNYDMSLISCLLYRNGGS